MVSANSDFRFPSPTSRPSQPIHRPVKLLRWSDYRRPLTSEDLRIHAWLNERLAELHRERHGLWTKVRHILFGHRSN
jgi:hypothetical protein